MASEYDEYNDTNGREEEEGNGLLSPRADWDLPAAPPRDDEQQALEEDGPDDTPHTREKKKKKKKKKSRRPRQYDEEGNPIEYDSTTAAGGEEGSAEAGDGDGGSGGGDGVSVDGGNGEVQQGGDYSDEEMEVRERAALMIQRWVRGWFARQLIKKLREEQKETVSKVLDSMGAPNTRPLNIVRRAGGAGGRRAPTRGHHKRVPNKEPESKRLDADPLVLTVGKKDGAAIAAALAAEEEAEASSSAAASASPTTASSSASEPEPEPQPTGTPRSGGAGRGSMPGAGISLAALQQNRGNLRKSHRESPADRAAREKAASATPEFMQKRLKTGPGSSTNVREGSDMSDSGEMPVPRQRGNTVGSSINSAVTPSPVAGISTGNSRSVNVGRPHGQPMLPPPNNPRPSNLRKLPSTTNLASPDEGEEREYTVIGFIDPPAPAPKEWAPRKTKVGGVLSNMFNSRAPVEDLVEQGIYQPVEGVEVPISPRKQQPGPSGGPPRPAPKELPAPGKKPSGGGIMSSLFGKSKSKSVFVPRDRSNDKRPPMSAPLSPDMPPPPPAQTTAGPPVALPGHRGIPPPLAAPGAPPPPIQNSGGGATRPPRVSGNIGGMPIGGDSNDFQGKPPGGATRPPRVTGNIGLPPSDGEQPQMPMMRPPRGPPSSSEGETNNSAPTSPTMPGLRSPSTQRLPPLPSRDDTEDFQSKPSQPTDQQQNRNALRSQPSSGQLKRSPPSQSGGSPSAPTSGPAPEPGPGPHQLRPSGPKPGPVPTESNNSNEAPRLNLRNSLPRSGPPRTDDIGSGPAPVSPGPGRMREQMSPPSGRSGSPVGGSGGPGSARGPNPGPGLPPPGDSQGPVPRLPFPSNSGGAGGLPPLPGRAPLNSPQAMPSPRERPQSQMFSMPQQQTVATPVPMPVPVPNPYRPVDAPPARAESPRTGPPSGPAETPISPRGPPGPRRPPPARPAPSAPGGPGPRPEAPSPYGTEQEAGGPPQPRPKRPEPSVPSREGRKSLRGPITTLAYTQQQE
eukprot:TRINITY_DN7652_c0_g1_i1.p1 TRINITY_DN7652_c0_g1~~TRINITY_DN7652_c0_g1_i1.p1  ORF type:complete len:1016 (+),score=178.71 TRINITY_DN7652_c0_g1_i1:239-3286(+)